MYARSQSGTIAARTRNLTPPLALGNLPLVLPLSPMVESPAVSPQPRGEGAPAPRRYLYWTAAEDQALLEHRPGRGPSLRELAEELGRTYYAARRRRKDLASGRLSPGGAHRCSRCESLLPERQKHGHCPACRAAPDKPRTSRTPEEIASATNAGLRWKPLDDAILMSSPTVTLPQAHNLGRTQSACWARRRRLAL